MDFRPIEAADVKFAWAAYKEGALAGMAGPFAAPGLDVLTFKQTFEALLIGPAPRYHGAWTLFAQTRTKGFLPVGMVFAFYSHAEHVLSPFMIVGDIVWFPWASRRNRVEAAVNFLSIIRKTVPLMDYAHGEKNRKFWDAMCAHAVVRRVGTTFNVVKGEPTAIYETRTD